MQRPQQGQIQRSRCEGKERQHDEVDIRGIGVEKTAFFMITSDTTSTFDFLGAMIFGLMFTKMFEQAHNTAVTENHGQQGSYSEADQILGRYLINPAEIGRLERDECLVLITGVPFRSMKFYITKHPCCEELK